MKTNGAETIVRSLATHQARFVYGLPGFTILDIYDAIRKEKSIYHVLAMHEINAAFMADAHGRLKGEPGVCLVTSGSGATNSLTGIAQAYAESSPVVQIAGLSGLPTNVHEDEYLLKIFQPLTKWTVRIKNIEEIPSVLDKAFFVASSGRPGPVFVGLSREIIESSAEAFPHEQSKPNQFSPDNEQHKEEINAAVEVLALAAKPIIIVGKGVLREFCSDSVVEFSNHLGAPILTLANAISAIPYECPPYIGYDLTGDRSRWTTQPAIASIINESDVILTLGLDFRERQNILTKGHDKIIHIHKDDSTQSSTAKSDREVPLNIEASIKSTLDRLKKKLWMTQVNQETLRKRIAEFKKNIREDVAKSIEWGNKPIHPGEISTTLRLVLDDHAIITLDVGNNAEWMKICCRPQGSNTILTTGSFGAMGFALPAAIAAKLNYPSRQVVAVTGDGGFLMSYMDFPTLIKYRLNVVVVVENNKRYGLIWNMQRSKYRGRTFATELEIPSFAEYARAFGAQGIKVTDPKDLKSAFEEGLDTKGPTLIDVDTAYDVQPYLPTGTTRRLWKARAKLIWRSS